MERQNAPRGDSSPGENHPYHPVVKGDLLNFRASPHFSFDNVTKISYNTCTIKKFAWHSDPRAAALAGGGSARARGIHLGRNALLAP